MPDQPLIELRDTVKRFGDNPVLNSLDLVIYKGEITSIIGKSGVGKSECALDLITKGHLLVADDVVIIHKIGTNWLMAQGAELIKNLIEIRGIGIVDVQSLFGSIYK